MGVERILPKILMKIKKMEVAIVTLDNAHKENKKAENERSLAHLLFFIFEVVVRVGLDFELG